MTNLARLRSFIRDMTRLADRHGEDEQRMLDEGDKLLRSLIERDDWLPEEFARPSAEGYRQYLLHCDPMERFSVVSFVWMPGQRTPVHDHTVWGLVGVMRGEETCEEYSREIKPTARHPVRRGQVDRVSPRIGDIHVVANEGGEVAVSIHVYGANIGAVRRHTYDPENGARRDFVSGYANASIPNLWDRSREA